LKIKNLKYNQLYMAVNLNNQNPNQAADSKTAAGWEDKMNGLLLRLSRVPLKEKLFFVRHLSIMLKAGISLSIGLYTLAAQTEHKYFAFVLKSIAAKVEKGTSFTDSLKTFPKIFSEMFISMVEAGEISSKLENVLNELYVQMKKEHTLIAKVKGALTYPAVIMIAMVGIGTFMLVFVVPKITAIFKEMSVDLPLPTKILIKTSEFIARHGLITGLSFILSIIVAVKILRTSWGKYALHTILLKMPVFGPIVKKINLARFARNISSLLKTDIMIIKSFQITANVIGNIHYRQAINNMCGVLKKGDSIASAVKQYPTLFPPIVSQMVAIGEETGELDNILIELAEFYEEEVNQVMDNLPAIIEPLLILILGVGVGGVAVAIILPMYKITEAV